MYSTAGTRTGLYQHTTFEVAVTAAAAASAATATTEVAADNDAATNSGEKRRVKRAPNTVWHHISFVQTNSCT